MTVIGTVWSDLLPLEAMTVIGTLQFGTTYCHFKSLNKTFQWNWSLNMKLHENAIEMSYGNCDEASVFYKLFIVISPTGMLVTFASIGFFKSEKRSPNLGLSSSVIFFVVCSHMWQFFLFKSSSLKRKFHSILGLIAISHSASYSNFDGLVAQFFTVAS